MQHSPSTDPPRIAAPIGAAGLPSPGRSAGDSPIATWQLKARGPRVMSWFFPPKAEIRHPLPSPDHAFAPSTTASERDRN